MTDVMDRAERGLAAAAAVGTALALACCLQQRRNADGASDRPTHGDRAAGASVRTPVPLRPTPLTAWHGDQGRVLAELLAGGAVAVALLEHALEHAHTVLQSQSPPSRDARRATRRLLERAEVFAERLDAVRCDGIARVGDEELAAVCTRLGAVQRLAAGDAPERCADAVAALLDSLERCDEPSLQAVALLSAEPSRHGARQAVTLLAALPRDPLTEPSAGECGILIGVVQRTAASPGWLIADRESAWMALYTLAVRNGLEVAASSDLCQRACESWIPLVQEVNATAHAGTARLAAAHRAVLLAACQGIVSAPASVRAPLEAALLRSLKNTVPEFLCYSNATVRRAVRALTENIAGDQDTGLAVGAAYACQELIMFRSPAATETALEFGSFQAGLDLFRRLWPAPPEPAWWVERLGTVDVGCVELWGVWTLLGATHILATTVPAATWMATDWWRPVLFLAVHMAQVNEAAAGMLLEDCGSVHFGAVCYAIRTIEAAAREESQHAFLLQSGVPSALTHAVVYDLSFLGLSLKAVATSALVELLGNREDFVLDATVTAHVVETFCHCFDQTKWQHTLTAGNMLIHARELATCLLSDANKLAVLEHAGTVKALVAGLLLEEHDPRFNHGGADAVRETCAEALLELAMLQQGAEMLRDHDGVVSALAKLCCSDVAKLRVCAEQTLHRIEASPCDEEPSTLDASTLNVETKQHVMLSHSWDDQLAAARIATALRSRGYRVAIDVDLESSTLSGMRSAVQTAGVALVCVSRAYKESAICRAEAQHAQQAGLPMLPLLLQPGYKPSGWLLQMLGRQVQYSFYDDTLSSPSAFDSRMDEIARALGGLGFSPTTRQIDVSVILPADDAEEKSGVAVADRLLAGEGSRRQVLTQALEHVLTLLVRSSRDDASRLSRKTRAELRTRATALLDGVSAGSTAVLCAGTWSPDVGKSTGALLSDVFKLEDLRNDQHVDRVEFLLTFLEKLSAIIEGRLTILVGLIRGGGKRCSSALLAVLDHGMHVLDSIAMGGVHDSPHRSMLLSLSTRVSHSTDVDGKFNTEFCNMLAAACGSGRAEAQVVAELILRVERMTVVGDPAESSAKVSALLDGLETAVAAERPGQAPAAAAETVTPQPQRSSKFNLSKLSPRPRSATTLPAVSPPAQDSGGALDLNPTGSVVLEASLSQRSAAMDGTMDLTDQLSRLRQERNLLVARAASPASRGDV